MKKWPLLTALVAIGIIGCGGGGDAPVAGTTGNPTGGGPGGNDGRSSANVNLGIGPGLIQAYFLPGQGRVEGSPTAVITTVRFFDNDGNTEPAEEPLAPALYLQLDGFDVLNRPVNAPLIGSQQSRTFDDYEINVRELRVEDAGGGFQTFTGPGGNPPFLSDTFSNQMLLTVFPGRVSALQIFLNEAMLNVDENGNRIWNRDEFLRRNINPTTGKITGFLSDYVLFDITNVPNKPKMASPGVAGQDATKVFISGDFYALGRPGTTGVFEVLTPFGQFEGIFRPADQVTGLKTYELKQNDPRYVEPPRLITSLKGIYRNYTEVLNNTGQYEFITFPKTGDTARQELAIVQRNMAAQGQPIVNMWFGEVDFTISAQKPNPTFKAYPIGQVQPASTANEIRGTLDRTKLVGANGAPVSTTGTNWWRLVRSGDYAFQNAPAGTPGQFVSGRFIVFRR
ncbi:MAG TPA: hypothetical protein VEX38_01310 [Fimbriimonadaceae bacterium]|nr:hypothetical protein [Fimbriimonadaceae bacterium]